MATMIIDDLALEARAPLGYKAELSDDFLARKFLRPDRRLEKIVYEITNDVALLHQYFHLREQMFISVWGLQHFCGQKDQHDDVSDIMVARIGNHVIGGCRVTFSGARALPMETAEFRLSAALPELPLADVVYTEISRMVILPEFQDGPAMAEISRQLIARCAERKARYAFMLASAPLARAYRREESLSGRNWQFCSAVEVPERAEYDVSMVLSMLDLASVYPTKKAATKRRTKARELAVAE